MRYVWLAPLLALAAWLGLIEPAAAPAQYCGSTYSSYRSYSSYRTKKYEDVIIVPRFVAILADLPSYSATFTPPVVAIGAPQVAVQPGVTQVQPGVTPVPGAAPAVQQPQPVAPPPQPVPGRQAAPQQPPPAPAPAPVSPCEATLKAVVDTLARINARLDRLEGVQQQPPQRQGYAPPPSPPPPPQRRNGEEGPPPGKDDNGGAKAPPGGQPGYAKCAACHEASKATDEGGGFVMFNGQLRAELTSGQKVKMARKLRRGEMPPPDNKHKITPITSEEYDALAESFGF